MLRPLPLESGAAVLVFAIARLVLALVALVTVLALGLPYAGRGTRVGRRGAALDRRVYLLARRTPAWRSTRWSPRWTSPFCCSSRCRRPRRSARYAWRRCCSSRHTPTSRANAVGCGGRSGSISLVVATQLRGDEPVSGDILALETVAFVLSALATALVVGVLRTSESASRLRARGLSRRILRAEGEVRRRVAESIHDGPVQELIALDLILSAAETPPARAGPRERRANREARELTARNLVSFVTRSSISVPTPSRSLAWTPRWRTAWRSGDVATASRRLRPSSWSASSSRPRWPATCSGSPRRRVNAGRHADAPTCRSSSARPPPRRAARDRRRPRLCRRRSPGPPTRAPRLASMRERAELLDGQLDIETSEQGPRVRVRLPRRRSRQASAGAARTGMPFRSAMPASRSRSPGRAPASTFTFVPAWRLASCQPPRWPQPCGSATVPRFSSSVTITGTVTEPCGDSSRVSPPSRARQRPRRRDACAAPEPARRA